MAVVHVALQIRLLHFVRGKHSFLRKVCVVIAFDVFA